MSELFVLKALENAVGKKQFLFKTKDVAPYCQGFREGYGMAVAVVTPTSLLDMWKVIQIAVAHDLAIVMQAANTGLTGGSTPSTGCDRDIMIISTRKLEDIHLLQKHNQIIAFPGASLFKLEKLLQPLGRKPHSVIGSYC